MKLLVTGGKGLVGSAINADVKLGREYNLINPQEANKAFDFNIEMIKEYNNGSMATS